MQVVSEKLSAYAWASSITPLSRRKAWQGCDAEFECRTQLLSSRVQELWQVKTRKIILTASVRLDSKLVRDKSGAPLLKYTNLLFRYISLGQRARGLVHESSCECPLELLFAHKFYIVPASISPNIAP